MYKLKYNLLNRYEHKSKDYIELFKYSDLIRQYNNIDIISIYNIDKNRYHFSELKYMDENDNNNILINKKIRYGKSFDILTNDENFKCGILYCKGFFVVELINNIIL